MHINDLLTWITQGALLLVTALTLIDFIRQRDQARLDIALMFSVLAAIILVQRVASLSDLPRQWSGLGASFLVLAQPYLLLRLVQHFRPVRRSVRLIALAGLIISWTFLLALGTPLPPPVTLLMVAYFVYVEGYAATAFVRGALGTGGVTHWRLLLAAAGSGLLAGVIILAGIIAVAPAAREVVSPILQTVSLCAMLSYYAGFAPPRWLRQVWQLSELQRFLREMAGRPASERATMALDHLCLAATRAVGGLAATAALRDETGQRLKIQASSGGAEQPALLPIDGGAIGRAWNERRPAIVRDPEALGPAGAAMAAATGACAFLVIPIVVMERAWGVLIIHLRHTPLFPADDLNLLTLFTEQSAIALDYAMLLTEQRALEDQLRRKNNELADQNRRIQAASRLKSEFLANMSHELRTPLNGIIGFAELMHDGKVGPVSAEHQEYLGDILASARHLLQLINDILDLAKVESGKLEFRPEPVDLNKLVGEVRDILRTLIAQKRIQLEISVDQISDKVVVDPARLKQVLYNYLSNALKFTPEGGRVTVWVTPEGADAFRLTVEDTGIGIRPEDIGRLFNEFEQLDASASKKYQGTGLGLALTKRIVEAQGGTVGVESVYGQGSRFFAVLPRLSNVTVEPAPARRVPPPTPEQPGQPTVLVIEDNPYEQAWIRQTLESVGYVVVTAETGAEAVARCQERRFDAITLDLLLPDMGGWDVLRAIRATDQNGNVSTIVMTVVAERTVGTGFSIHDFLVKPVQAEELLASLQRAGIAPDAAATVLVIDDDPNVLKLMETILSRQGLQPVCRRDGESGLRAAEEHPPAAVVLDLLMPEMDGFEFLERFRHTPAGHRTPVIVWTNQDLMAADRARLQASVEAIVLKQHGGTGALLEELRTHLATRQTE